MPTGRRPTSRPGAGPGRGKARARSQARKTTPPPAAKTPKAAARDHDLPPEQGTTPTPDPVAEEQHASVVRRRSSITTRAIALAVVMLILTISYASSLRIYFSQQQDIAATRQEITDRKARIAELQREVDRWSDPAFVKAQARERLGWVVPGETGYKVVGPDGKPLAGGVEIGEEEKAPSDEKPRSWWGDLYGSAKTADDPPPAPETKPKDKAPITEDGSEDAESEEDGG